MEKRKKMIILISSIFGEEFDSYFSSISKNTMTFSGISYWRKLFNSLSEFDSDVSAICVSSPSTGTYPNHSNIVFFKSLPSDDKYFYVGYNNIFGISYFSKKNAMKKCLKRKVFPKVSKDTDIDVIVTEMYTPFMEVAVYIKKVFPNSTITLSILDVPEFFTQKETKLKTSFLRILDGKKASNLLKEFDGFICITRQINDLLNEMKRPSLILEGVSSSTLSYQRNKFDQNKNKYILYSGSIRKTFNIEGLIDAFNRLPNKNIDLILCGCGDMNDILVSASKHNERIHYLGSLPPSKITELQIKASVLVNPRTNNGIFNKYSFPSKTMEYLSTGNPVVASCLDGMPNEYKDLLISPKDDSNSALTYAIERALNMTNDELENYQNRCFSLMKKKTGKEWAKFILSLLDKERTKKDAQ